MNGLPDRVVCLPTQRLEAGMRVARPVLRGDGQVLLAEGAVLDADEMARFGQRGVEFVFVALPETRDAQTIARDAQAVRDRLDYVFRGDDDSDARAELREAVARYRLGESA